jgi:hypothetical protein
MDRRGVAKTSKDEFENNWNYAQCSVMTVDEPLRRLASSNHLYLPNRGIRAKVSASHARTEGTAGSLY